MKRNRQAAVRITEERERDDIGTVRELFRGDVADNYSVVERYQMRGLEIVCLDLVCGEAAVGDTVRIDKSGMVLEVL